MLKQISITFGSYAILNQLREKHSDRQQLLVQSDNTNDDIALIDVSGQKNIFKSGVVYDIKSHAGDSDWNKNFYSFIYLKNLSPDVQKVFNATANQLVNSPELPQGMQAIYFMKELKNRGNNIILTTWTDTQEFNSWTHSDEYARFKGFDTPLHDYRIVTYFKYVENNK